MADVTTDPHHTAEPSPWALRFLAGIATGGRVLDIACGGGRHLRAALARGYAVTGVDRNLAGIRDLSGRPGVTLIEADLETGARPPFEGEKFAGVIVTNYLWRPILPAIVAAVADDGMLIYETFALGHEKGGRRPSNPEFLLKPNELLAHAMPRLTVIAFEHGRSGRPSARVVQRIAAVGPHHPWIAEPPALD